MLLSVVTIRSKNLKTITRIINKGIPELENLRFCLAGGDYLSREELVDLVSKQIVVVNRCNGFVSVHFNFIEVSNLLMITYHIGRTL
jgi:hypothetical protein